MQRAGSTACSLRQCGATIRNDSTNCCSDGLRGEIVRPRDQVFEKRAEKLLIPRLGFALLGKH